MVDDIFIDRGNLLTSMGYSNECYANAFSTSLNPPPNKLLNTNTGENQEYPYFLINSFPLEDNNRLYIMLNAVISDYLNKISLSHTRKNKTALFTGSSSFDISTYDTLFRKQTKEFITTLPPLNIVAETISAKHGLSGYNFTFNTACSSSANAISHAANMIRSGVVNDALVIGYEVYNPASLLGFESLQLINKNSLPFSTHSNGMILGESIAVTLLSKKPDSPAFRYVNSWSKMNHSSMTGSVNDSELMESIFDHLLSKSQLEQQQIKLIKAHGSGSETSDIAESTAINHYFNPVPRVVAFKSLIGNTLGASGLSELLLLDRLITSPQSSNSCLLPQFKTDSRLKINPQAGSNPAADYSLLNYFGFGGSYVCQLMQNL